MDIQTIYLLLAVVFISIPLGVYYTSRDARARIVLWGAVLVSALTIVLVGENGPPTLLLGTAISAVLLLGVIADIVLRASHSETKNGEGRFRRLLAEQNQELLRHLLTDELTGLHNRRALEQSIHDYRSSAGFYTQPLSMVMMDIDQFKAINDTHGHGAGDQVLKQLSARWRAAVRASDLLARVGGDEFCLVLPNTTLTQANGIAEKIRRITSGNPMGLQQDPTDILVSITVSLGVATADDPKNIDLEKFMTLADDALYEAKRNGRNQVVTRRYN
ncbi:MAG: GGDEF domain-containing protein [Burkholderiaceae bacterium]